MKSLTTLRLTGALWAGVLLWLFSANAFALTTAGNSVNNAAIAGYSVGGVTQDSICSAPGVGNSVPTNGTTTTSSTCTGGGTVGSFSTGTYTTFVVDDMVSLSVTRVDTSDIVVTPGQTQAVLRFNVVNNGNATQGVTLAALNEASTTTDPNGGAVNDSWDGTITPVGVKPNQIGAYVSATPGACGVATTFVASTDSASDIGQLAAGATQCVFVVANVPAGLADGVKAVMAMQVRTDNAGGSGYGAATGGAIDQQSLGAGHEDDDSTHAWTANAEQIIFADAQSPYGAGQDGDSAFDGYASNREAFVVHAAQITVTKIQQVISDPVAGTCLVVNIANGTSNNITGNNGKCHAIPGAVIAYTITVSNASGASSSATGITVADTVPGNETIVASVAGTPTFSVADPNVSGTLGPGAPANGNPNVCLTSGSTSTFTTGAFTATCSYTSGTTTVNATINTLQKNETYTLFFEATVN